MLHKHGIFTFAETAREAYALMIDMVSRAEARLAKGRRNVFAPAALPAEPRVRRGGGTHHPRRLRGAGVCARRRAAPLRGDLPHRAGDPRTTSTAPISPTTASAAW